MEYHFVIGVHVAEAAVKRNNKVLGYRVISVPSLSVRDIYATDMVRALSNGIKICNMRLQDGKAMFIGGNKLNYPLMHNGRVMNNLTQSFDWGIRQQVIETIGETVLARHGNCVYVANVSGSTRILEIKHWSEKDRERLKRNTVRMFTNMDIDENTVGKILSYEEAGISSNSYNDEGLDINLARAVKVNSAINGFDVKSNGTLSNMTNYDVEQYKIGYPISIVGRNAFYDNKSIKKITINKGVTQIGEYAFYGASNLDEVIFVGSDCNEIGDYAFRCCNKLKQITLPNNAELRIGNRAISEYTTKIILPSKVGLDVLGATAYDRGALLYAMELLAIKIEKPGPHTITKYQFKTCTKLMLLAFVSGYIQRIGEHALHGCRSMRKLDLRKTRIIGDCALAYTQLESVELNEIEIIGEYAFYNIASLRRIIIRSEKLQPILYRIFGGVMCNIEIICNNERAYDIMKSCIKIHGAEMKYVAKLVLDRNI